MQRAVPSDPKTVLIVEDQMELRAINAALLEHHGYRVVAVGDGSEGLRCAREQHPDLILMDISVPGVDGLRATRELKDDPRTEHIPVVIVTAHPYGSVGPRLRQAASSASRAIRAACCTRSAPAWAPPPEPIAPSSPRPPKSLSDARTRPELVRPPPRIAPGIAGEARPRAGARRRRCAARAGSRVAAHRC
jgi:CheY-like chemotaxis protein